MPSAAVGEPERPGPGQRAEAGAGDPPQAPERGVWGTEGRHWALEETLEQRARETQCVEGSASFTGCGKFVG